MKLFSYQEALKNTVKILQEVKDEKTFDEAVERLKAIISIMEDAKEANLLDFSSEGEFKVTNQVKAPIEPQKAEPSKLKLNEDEFIFKRKLLGGKLIGIKHSHLSESIIKNLDLNDGDVVKVPDIKNINHDLAKTGKTSEVHKDSNIEFLPHCEIKEEGSTLYCDSYFSDGLKTIKFDGLPFKAIISKYDVDKHNLSVGDYVDLTCLKSDYSSFRVVWKHEISRYTAPKKSGAYKPSKSDEIQNEAFNDIDFKGKTIHVIGLEPRKSFYKKAIENCNGKFLFNSGEEAFTRVSANIRKADVVVILKEFLTHSIVWDSVEFAKKHSIPFKVADGLGIQTVVFEARDLINS